ncbi:MAG: ABC transporter ATP-binding protein/permease [Coriobacteriaceae bacterium]|nr:ABC transporter ATP-binding protein/permease [Coriobacteriaceae bacterium]
MLQLFNVRKSYKTAGFSQTALNSISVAFRDNEFVAILGPSGSGKTTLLNIVGGLDHYDSGDLVIDGISTKQYKDRDWDTYRNNRIGFVFQSYNLIPHQTVLANVELALTLSGVSRSERKKRAREALIQVGLADHINKRPNQLSGGQMQRVAVARALINDPEILLADEPTGALDSATSVQIMELLTEIAKDRLVIMVTHNPELAQSYANRTVNLRDGNIVDDSNPFTPAAEDDKLSEKSIRRTAMSFLTAIALSFNNLMTKKGRTIMTAFAGSIGIIGIAAILALANGVNNYIKSVEEDTLTVYPLSIESTGIDMTAMMASMMSSAQGSATPAEQEGGQGSASREEGEGTHTGTIGETKTLSDMFSHIGSNDLASLKSFLDSDQSGIDPYVNMVSYSYGIRPLIFNPDTSDGVRQINPNTAFTPLSQGSLTGTAGNYASMMTSGSNTNIFHEMLNNPPLLEVQYDVVAGAWPSSYDECVLVLNFENRINDFTLYAMGLRDPAELDRMVSEVADNVEVSVPLDELEFTYDEILAVKFKLVNAADYYVKDEQYQVWKNKSDDTAFMKKLVAQGTDLRIVGIIAPKPDAQTTALSPGICYTSSLQTYLIEQAAQAPVVKEQLANPELDVITGRTFADERENPDRPTLDFSSMVSIDGEAISGAFSFDPSALQVDASGFSNLSFNPGSVPALPPFDISSLLTGLSVDIPQDQVNALVNDLLTGFIASYAPSDPTNPFDPAEISAALESYLSSPATQALVMAGLGGMVDASGINSQIQNALQGYMQTAMQSYLGAFASSMQRQLSSAMATTMSQLSANMAGAMSIDEEAFKDAFKMNVDEKELLELMTSLMTVEETSYESNLKKLGYADFAKPSTIRLYPKDFQGKGEIIGILDSYNDRMKAEGQDEKVIVYTDIVGTLMSSVTDIVNMVSYVLVAFVAISLVVSSIMIGIITYISVLERRKEIGILRSIGASKKDISHVFNAETLIVGFVAGALGIGITALACIPANIIVYEGFGVANVAQLPWEAAAVLVLISMFLSFVSGLIPSSAASRKDPVEALRSE